MHLIKDYSIEYANAGGRSTQARIREFRGPNQPRVIVYTSMDRIGVSITNAAERIATLVARQEGNPTDVLWIEHYPEGDLMSGERFARVSFQQRPNGTFHSPTWEGVGKSWVETLIGQQLTMD